MYIFGSVYITIIIIMMRSRFLLITLTAVSWRVVLCLFFQVKIRENLIQSKYYCTTQCPYMSHFLLILFSLLSLSLSLSLSISLSLSLCLYVSFCLSLPLTLISSFCIVLVLMNCYKILFRPPTVYTPPTVLCYMQFCIVQLH